MVMVTVRDPPGEPWEGGRSFSKPQGRSRVPSQGNFSSFQNAGVGGGQPPVIWSHITEPVSPGEL